MQDPIKPVTVAELIAWLQQQRQDLPVAYCCFSEACLLQLEERSGHFDAPYIEKLQPHRHDGWVHDARPDAPSIEYLVFPGN